MKQPTRQQLRDFANKRSWHNQMRNSQGLDSYSNYSGPSMGDLVVVVGRNRDSELLEESNFQAALDMLGGESDSVKVERFGHWGCGWFELILVNPQDTKSLIEAYKICKSLEEHPLLDESDYFERENEYFHGYAEQAKGDLAQALVHHLGLPQALATDPEMLGLAYSLNIECQHYAGADSRIDIYKFRTPDDQDIRRLISVMGQLRHTEDSEAYKFLEAALGLYEEAI